MKRPLRLFLMLAVVVAAAVVWLTHNLDITVENAIVQHGSAMTKARVSVDAVKIEPANGKGSLDKFEIGNPEGFRTAYALKAEKIDIHVDIASVTKDVILIHLVAINGPDIIYEKGQSMTNFDGIAKNISAYVGSTRSRGDGGEKKLIVEELTIYNARAQASAPFLDGKTISIPLPDIILRNLGTAKGGITPGELGQEVAEALKAKLRGVANFDRIRQSTGETLDRADKTLKGQFK